MDFQKSIDGMNKMAEDTRSDYHLTLGEAINRVSELPNNVEVIVDIGGSLTEPHSYRGYYSDLAFEPTDEGVTSQKFLFLLKESLGKTFEGYKGGDFVMGKKTPLWLSHYGTTGRAIISASFENNKLILITKEV